MIRCAAFAARCAGGVATTPTSDTDAPVERGYCRYPVGIARGATRWYRMASGVVPGTHEEAEMADTKEGRERGEVTFEARVSVDDGTAHAERVETFATVQAARQWVLSHATITKVVRRLV